MREHHGNVINQNFVTTMVNFWKVHSHEIQFTYEEFVRGNTGWTHEEFVAWCANGRLPK